MRWRLIHIPKCAGTAIADAYGYGTEPGHPHLPSELFGSNVKLFAIIREPLDRAVSICAYIHSAYNIAYNRVLQVDEFRRWAASGCPSDFDDGSVRVVSFRGVGGLRITSQQVKWIDNRVTLLRFDRLEEDVTRQMDSLGIAPKPLARVKPSRRLQETAAYYDRATQNTILRHYWQDVELWERMTGRQAACC
jgi:hypothetical protein